MEPRISIITLGVKSVDQSIRFYRDGLGFSTKASLGDSIAFFSTTGTRLAVYPLGELAQEIGLPVAPSGPVFSGFTLAHNVRRQSEVAEVMALAERAGGKVIKPAQDTFWGGHSGYFTDPDGYPWEVAWAPMFQFDDSGALLL